MGFCSLLAIFVWLPLAFLRVILFSGGRVSDLSFFKSSIHACRKPNVFYRYPTVLEYEIWLYGILHSPIIIELTANSLTIIADRNNFYYLDRCMCIRTH